MIPGYKFVYRSWPGDVTLEATETGIDGIALVEIENQIGPLWNVLGTNFNTVLWPAPTSPAQLEDLIAAYSNFFKTIIRVSLTLKDMHTLESTLCPINRLSPVPVIY